MYKVMVVDDEDLIVRGLCSLVPWAKYDCMVVATASNGRQALSLASERQPEIMFTDINMPEMDGLSMIAALRTQYPTMRISILTGHPVFEYAQRAIQMGVSAYLLKPSKLDQLEAALSTMVRELKEIEEYQAKQAAEQAAAAAAFFASQQPVQVAQPQPLPQAQPVQSAVTEDEAEQQPVLLDDPQMLPSPMDAALESTQNFVIKNAIRYMEENYNKKISLLDVAEHVYVSQWHLSKLIARNTNQNFSDILNGIRIKKAKELLKNPALRIWEISEMVGFGDVSHFSRIFKKYERISANEYRNSLTASRN